MNLLNILFIWFVYLLIGFVEFEIKQWFLAYQDQFCAWLSLARLLTARVFFLSHFLEKDTALCLSYLFNASTILFSTYLLPNHVIYLNSQNFPPF